MLYADLFRQFAFFDSSCRVPQSLIFPKFPSLITHGKFLEIFRPFETLFIITPAWCFVMGQHVLNTVSGSPSPSYLFSSLWLLSAPPQLYLSVGEAQFPQTRQLLLPILQGLKLGQAPYSGSLLPKGLVQCRWSKALPLGHAPALESQSPHLQYRCNKTAGKCPSKYPASGRAKN